MVKEYHVRRASAEDINAIKSISISNNSSKEDNYWEQCCTRMKNEELWAFISENRDGEAVGYGFLNWKPKYRVYEQLNIPEIQDLNVVSTHRRKGVATSIIRECEVSAEKEGRKEIGISYGLTKDYGYAQRLYTSLGFVPDGYGVTYDRQPVQHGQFKPVDDNLCLMLIKPLKT